MAPLIRNLGAGYGDWSTLRTGHFNPGKKDPEQVAYLSNRQIFKDLCILDRLCVAVTLA
jgi:hypothetical protein